MKRESEARESDERRLTRRETTTAARATPANRLECERECVR